MRAVLHLTAWYYPPLWQRQDFAVNASTTERIGGDISERSISPGEKKRSSSISVRINIVGFRAGIYAEKLQFLRRQAHFLEQFPPGTVLRALVDLTGAAGIAPFVIVRAPAQKYPAFFVYANDARSTLHDRSVPDQFPHLSHVPGHFAHSFIILGSG